jgi:tetratricopeptide (TPR) repeat protein
MRAGAAGAGRESQRDRWIDDEAALGHVVLWAGLLLCGYALYLSLGRTTLVAYGVLVLLLLPAMLALLGMEESLKRALDPGAWMELFRLVGGGDYLLAIAKLIGVVLLVCFVQFALLPPMPGWLHWSIVQLAWLAGLFAAYHELGRMVGGDHARSAARADGETAQPAQLTEEEELALRAAGRYGAEERFARAARELEALASRPGVSPPVHARFRELLFLAGQHAGLVAHARRYVPELLSLDQRREALALYQDSQALDPEFELAEPATLTKMIGVALDERQPDLAVALAREFLRRFPEEPDAVPNGLSAARLLDRQGHDEQSRQLLVELVRRFPNHPQRAELVAALETLESVARRGR